MDGLILQPSKYAPEDIKDMGLVLVSEAKNNQAREFGRRVGADVCESSVKCDEDSTLSECRARDALIGGTSEAFLECR